MKRKMLFGLMAVGLLLFGSLGSAGKASAMNYYFIKIGDLFYHLYATGSIQLNAAYVCHESSNTENYAGVSGKVVIPEEVKFKGTTYTVVGISNSAFINAATITEMVIPKNVIEIGGEAFKNSGIWNNETNWKGGCLYVDGCLVASKDDLKGTCIVQDGTRLIAKFAFENSQITGVTFPNTIQTINQAAFRNSSLKSVTLPASPEYTKIDAQIFLGCSSLERVVCPANINLIASVAFENCTSVKEIYLYSPVKVSTSDRAFENVDVSKVTVYVPRNLVTSYKADSKWDKFNIQPLPPVQVDGIYYELNGEKNTAIIVAEKKGSGNYKSLTGKVTIPKTISVDEIEYTVTSMDEGAFSYAPMTEIVINAELTTIPDHAFFWADKLTDVTLPKTVTSIGYSAFASCAALVNVEGLTCGNSSNLPNLTTIGDNAFEDCESISFLMLNSVTSIGENSFAGCSNLQTIHMRETVTGLGTRAFYNCSKLIEFYNYASKPQTYPDGLLSGVNKAKLKIYVPAAGRKAFVTADGWKDFTIVGMGSVVDGITYNIDDATGTASVTFQTEDLKNYADLKDQTITIPSSVYIGNQTYTVTAIEAKAFKSAPIKKIVLPNTIQSIGDYAFNFCSVEEADLSKIENPCLLGVGAFYYCEKLKEITIQGSISKINEAAFGDCHALEKVVLPSGVQEIGEYAFSNCVKLDDLQMSSVTTIGAYAFQHCEELGRLTLPETVTSIGIYAFNECTDLYEIYNLASTPQTINANVFNGLTLGSINLYVPPTRKDAYEAKEVWKDFNVKEAKAIVDGLYYRIDPSSHTAQLTYDDIVYTYTALSGKVTVPASIEYNAETYDVTSIGNYAFRNNTTITEIVLPEGIITIGWECFNKMTALTKLNIPSTVETIGTFDNNGITANDANYKNGMLIIDNCLLRAKKDLTGMVTIPDGTRIIAVYAFSSCKEITKVTMPETVKEIGDYAFKTCVALTEINLPEGLRVLRRGVFQDCQTIGITTFAIPESVVEIERDAFGYGGKGCSQLVEIFIPSNVRKINTVAFWHAGLRFIHLPANIEYLDSYAFSDLIALEDVYIEAADPATITMEEKVFDGAPAGVKLHVPYGTKALYEAADQWKDFIIEEMNPCIDGFYYILDDVKKTATLTYQLKRTDWSSAINYQKLNKESWTIPAKVALNSEVYDVVALDESAFKNTIVKKIILPEGLTSIGEDAISENPNLEEVRIPSTVTEIGDFAFYYSTALKRIYNNATTPQDIKDKGVFGNAEIDKSKVKLYVPSDAVDAYKAADEWKDFDIQAQPVVVDGLCYLLDEVNGTATVTYQYDDESNYSELESVVVIPATITVEGKDYTVTAIGDNAFKYSDVSAFYIQADIQSIGHNAFAYLQYGYEFWLYTLKTPLSIGEDVFENSNRTYLCVPFGSKEAYKAADVWKDFPGGIFEMPVLIDGIYYELYEDESVLSADVDHDFSFRNYENLGEEIVIPNVVTWDEKEYKVDGAYFMNDNTVVKKITISNGIKYLGWSCFKACTALEEVVLPESIEYFGSNCFAGCTALKQITNPNPIPVSVKGDVFDGVDISSVTLLVPANSVEAYKATEVWKEFKIEPMETPIVIAGQKITPDRYNTMISGEGITGDVFVTENGIFLDEKARIYSSEVPAIELTATDKVNKFIISGVHATIDGRITISGKAEVQINGELPAGIEHDGALSLFLNGYTQNHCIELTEGAQVKLILNGIESESKDSIYFFSQSEAIHTPFGASCDIHAGGNVDFFIDDDNCPIGYNDRTFALHNTTMILPYGGSVTEEGVFDAAGEEMFMLRLSTNAPIKQSGKAYPIELFGVTVSEGNAADILGDGKASYNAETNTLTLNEIGGDAWYRERDVQSLRVVKSSINVELKGKNDLSVSSSQERPAIEVESGDLRIFGDKDAVLEIGSYSTGIRGDQTEQYRVAIEGCTVNLFNYGNALEADSLYLDAASVHLESNYGVAWQSWNANKNGGLVLKHTVLKEGVVNVDKGMYFEPLPEYTVTFLDKDGNVLKTQVVFEGEAATAPDAPVVEGYTFAGWDKSFNVVKSDLTVQATYTKNPVYTVTFKDWDGSVIASVKVEEGKSAVKPDDPIREGYTFTGWDKSFDNVTSDLTVTAQYAINVFTVTFVDKDGKTLKTEDVEYGSAATAPAAPAVEGYHFTGWSAAFDKITSDLTVKAQYAINVYTVTFLDKDGKTIKTEEVEWGSSATAPDAPAVEGYHFTGWDKSFDKVTSDLTVKAQYAINVYTVTFLDKDGKTLKTEEVEHGKAATAPDAPAVEGYHFTGWSAAFDKVTADLTVKALYAINTYTVTFVDYDNKELKKETVEWGKSATAPSDPKREGYTFTGWDKNFSNITADLTVKAQYTINVYTVTFLDKDGNTLKTEKVKYGKSATAPEPPVVEGWTFAGWDKAFNVVTSDLTVQATYTQNAVYTVTFKDYDGSIIAEVKVEEGKSAVKPDDPIREGYTFTGWDKKFDNVTSDLTVTAQYTINVYTVTFVDKDGKTLKTEDVEWGSSATAPAAPAVEGYHFTGWDKKFDKITSDLTVKAQYAINVYTVTFVDKDGKTIKTEDVEHGSAATAPDAPVVEGYHFTGWDKTFDNVTSDLTVKAQYAINVYTVTFLDKDGKTIKTEDVEHGKSATAPDAPAVEGYHFTGWDKKFDKVTSDLTVKALYAINTYTVTFVDYDNKELKTETVEHGKAATAPADPKREGYTFTGWDKDFSNITADLTVKAQYAINVYTVTFLDKDGNTLKTEKVEHGKSATAPEAPVIEGWTFAGWDKAFNVVKSDLIVQATYTKNPVYTVTFKDWDGSTIAEVKVEEGKSAVKPDDPIREGYTFTGWDKSFDNVTSDLTVTAQYAINVFTVTFVDYNDAVLKTQKVEWGKAATAPSDPTREGYTFKGWDKDFSTITADLTVKAQYTINVYTVTFLDKDGNTLKTEKVEYGKAATAPEAPVVEGWTFAGWDKAFNVVKSDLTVQATYTKNPVYTVTFVDWDGSTIAEVKVEEGKSAVKPDDPIREGYTFTGWDKSFDNVTSDLTVTAQYAINTYTVTFVDYNDAVLKTEKVEWGKSATAPADPKREGYTFKGWDKDFSNITADLTVKAQYTINVYTVTFLDKDGKTIKVEKVEHGKAATAPEAPVVEGYTFIGWDKSFDNVTSDLTVTALYEEIIVVDYTPQNLSVVVEALGDDDLRITLSWDKVEGAASYDLQLLLGKQVIFAGNTFGMNVISLKLSEILQVATIAPGTYLIDWFVRSTDDKTQAISDWAQGEAFEITIKEPVQGVESIQPSVISSQKEMRNGLLYIIRNGRTYDSNGRLIQ